MRAAYRATKPSECWDWISTTEVQNLANRALRQARDSCHPPKGERWLADGCEWGSPATFVEVLTMLLVLHVQARAHAAEIPGYEHAPDKLSQLTAPRGRAK